MRRLYCWSAGGLVLVTAAAVGAGYACLHPNALLARFAGVTYTAATWCMSVGHAQQKSTQPNSMCACPQAGPVVFSDLQNPQALRASLGQLRAQMAADVGDIEDCEPVHGTMPLIDDEPTNPDILPPSARDTALPAERGLAQMWLQLFGNTTTAKKKVHKPAPTASQGSSEEAELATPNRPAKCLEDPTLNLQYPGCPYTGPMPGSRKVSPFFPQRRSPLEDGKQPMFGRYSLPDPNGAHEEMPIHPEVDTMEFRSSDAQAGEFDPHPL